VQYSWQSKIGKGNQLHVEIQLEGTPAHQSTLTFIFISQGNCTIILCKPQDTGLKVIIWFRTEMKVE